ncbi:hypothetical protein C8J57DRAFT_201723 [Mycena rebaudengoi]|nr:hypothetical protein C8J57DRAFT_201723 [Mycena rebaudengoi]
MIVRTLSFVLGLDAWLFRSLLPPSPSRVGRLSSFAFLVTLARRLPILAIRPVLSVVLPYMAPPQEKSSWRLKETRGRRRIIIKAAARARHERTNERTKNSKRKKKNRNDRPIALCTTTNYGLDPSIPPSIHPSSIVPGHTLPLYYHCNLHPSIRRRSAAHSRPAMTPPPPRTKNSPYTCTYLRAAT